MDERYLSESSILKEIKYYIDTDFYNYAVMIDGACSPEKIEMLSKIGVKGFILGTSALFGKGRSYQETIEKLRGL